MKSSGTFFEPQNLTTEGQNFIKHCEISLSSLGTLAKGMRRFSAKGTRHHCTSSTPGGTTVASPPVAPSVARTALARFPRHRAAFGASSGPIQAQLQPYLGAVLAFLGEDQTRRAVFGEKGEKVLVVRVGLRRIGSRFFDLGCAGRTFQMCKTFMKHHELASCPGISRSPTFGGAWYPFPLSEKCLTN